MATNMYICVQIHMCKYICAYMCPLFLSPTYLSAKIMLILIKFKLCLSKADEVPRPNPRMAGSLRVVDGPNMAGPEGDLAASA